MERVIAEEMTDVSRRSSRAVARCEGKTAMLFVGGSRAHHYQMLFAEIGMKTVAAGYEFAHRDDYEGRQVLPTIKVDADSQNIEQFEVLPDETRYRRAETQEELVQLQAAGLEFSDYQGMMPEMEEGALVIDDIYHFETERLLEIYKPDIFCAGHQGEVRRAEGRHPLQAASQLRLRRAVRRISAGRSTSTSEIDRMVNTKIWSFVQAPWEAGEELDWKRSPVRSGPISHGRRADWSRDREASGWWSRLKRVLGKLTQTGDCDASAAYYGGRHGTFRSDHQSGQNLPANRRHVCGSWACITACRTATGRRVAARIIAAR